MDAGVYDGNYLSSTAKELNCFCNTGKTCYDRADERAMIPYYDVWLRWQAASDVHHYILSVRDLNTNVLIRNKITLSGSSTYHILPTSIIQKNHLYRWSLCAVDAAGEKKYSDEMYFQIEYATSYPTDVHVRPTSYASANHIDYFIYQRTSGYGAILQQGVEKWNGISSQVHLHRHNENENPSYELGIFEVVGTIPGLLGRTYTGGCIDTILDPFENHTVTYNEIHIYGDQIRSLSGYTSDYSKTVVMHEVGHALSLAHTDYNSSSNAFNIDISHTIIDSTYGLYSVPVPLLMNSGSAASGFQVFPRPTTTDRDHLRIKWGA